MLKLWNVEDIELANKENVYEVTYGTRETYKLTTGARWLLTIPAGTYEVAVGMFEWLSKTMVNTNYTMFCAAGVVVAIPVTTVFLCLQKYYVEGVTGGAVKG
mgnify:CR=1 FL=1